MYQSVDENLDYDADELGLEPFDAYDHIVVARCQTILKQNVPYEDGYDINTYVDSWDDVGSENLLSGAILTQVSIFSFIGVAARGRRASGTIVCLFLFVLILL